MQPWCIHMLLISNNTNRGTINAFNPSTGKFVGTVTGANGKAITINQLWGIEFGGGTSSNGQTNQLFWTAVLDSWARQRSRRGVRLYFTVLDSAGFDSINPDG